MPKEHTSNLSSKQNVSHLRAKVLLGLALLFFVGISTLFAALVLTGTTFSLLGLIIPLEVVPIFLLFGLLMTTLTARALYNAVDAAATLDLLDGPDTPDPLFYEDSGREDKLSNVLTAPTLLKNEDKDSNSHNAAVKLVCLIAKIGVIEKQESIGDTYQAPPSDVTLKQRYEEFCQLIGFDTAIPTPEEAAAKLKEIEGNGYDMLKTALFSVPQITTPEDKSVELPTKLSVILETVLPEIFNKRGIVYPPVAPPSPEETLTP